MDARVPGAVAGDAKALSSNWGRRRSSRPRHRGNLRPGHSQGPHRAGGVTGCDDPSRRRAHWSPQVSLQRHLDAAEKRQSVRLVRQRIGGLHEWITPHELGPPMSRVRLDAVRRMHGGRCAVLPTVAQPHIQVGPVCSATRSHSSHWCSGVVGSCGLVPAGARLELVGGVVDAPASLRGGAVGTPAVGTTVQLRSHV
jgi:hypothetical protein